MKVVYNDIEEGVSEISGEVTASVDFVSGESGSVSFRFIWDKIKRAFSLVEGGEISFEGRTLAYFDRFGNMGHWILKEHRDNHPEYNELVRRVFGGLEQELERMHPIDSNAHIWH